MPRGGGAVRAPLGYMFCSSFASVSLPGFAPLGFCLLCVSCESGQRPGPTGVEGENAGESTEASPDEVRQTTDSVPESVSNEAARVEPVPDPRGVSVEADVAESPPAQRAELYADDELSVTRRNAQCEIRWADERLTVGCAQSISRVRIDGHTEALHLVSGSQHALVVQRTPLRSFGDPNAVPDASWARIEYVDARFPEDGTARFGYLGHERCRPRRRDIERARAAGWPDHADISRLQWRRPRMRERVFRLGAEGFRDAAPWSAWRGSPGACELSQTPGPLIGVDRIYTLHGGGFRHRLAYSTTGEVMASVSLPALAHRTFFVSVGAGPLRALLIEDLHVVVSGRSLRNACAPGGCLIPRGETHNFPVRLPEEAAVEALRILIRGRAGREVTVSSIPSSHPSVSSSPSPISEQNPRELFRDDAHQVSVHSVLGAAVGSPPRARIRWAGRSADLTTPAMYTSGAPTRVEAVPVMVGGRRLLHLRLHWMEDFSDTEAYLLDRAGGTLRVLPMALDANRRSLTGAEFLPGGRIRIRRHETRTCTPTPREVRHSEREYGLSPGGAAAYFDSWARARLTWKYYRISIDGTIALTPTPWRSRGAWGRCKGEVEVIAACPFVDVLTNNGMLRVGEILRGVRFASATQTLALPPTHLLLEVRISEEKREVTYLDFIMVKVDGEHLPPESCDRGEPPAYCVADGRYARIERGDAIDLTFDTYAENGAVLVAEGYYEPY